MVVDRDREKMGRQKTHVFILKTWEKEEWQLGQNRNTRSGGLGKGIVRGGNLGGNITRILIVEEYVTYVQQGRPRKGSKLDSKSRG